MRNVFNRGGWSGRNDEKHQESGEKEAKRRKPT